MRGDIVQNKAGWFFRDNGDGTFDSLSQTTSTYDPANRTNTLASPTVTVVDQPVVLVRNGAVTGEGDRLAVRVAVVMARRYA